MPKSTYSLLLSITTLLGCAFLADSFVQAHGFGRSFEATVGKYVIDVDLDAFTLQAGKPVHFEFNLFDVSVFGDIYSVPATSTATTPATSTTTISAFEDELPFAQVLVVISQKNEIVFGSRIHNPEFGTVGMNYTFPRSGKYDLFVLFQKDGEKLAEATFPLTVRSSMFSVSLLVVLLIGLAVGSSLSLLVLTATNRRKENATDEQ